MNTIPPVESHDQDQLFVDVMICPFNNTLSDRAIAKALAHNYQSVLSSYFLEHPEELEILRYQRMVVVTRAHSNQPLTVVRQEDDQLWYADQLSTVIYSNLIEVSNEVA